MSEFEFSVHTTAAAPPATPSRGNGPQPKIRHGDIGIKTATPTQVTKAGTVIHNRMPLILAPHEYKRWLGDDPDPRDLLRPFPAEPMRMWPISTRVNKPENDDPSIVEPIALASSAA